MTAPSASRRCWAPAGRAPTRSGARSSSRCWWSGTAASARCVLVVLVAVLQLTAQQQAAQATCRSHPHVQQHEQGATKAAHAVCMAQATAAGAAACGKPAAHQHVVRPTPWIGVIMASIAPPEPPAAEQQRGPPVNRLPPCLTALADVVHTPASTLSACALTLSRCLHHCCRRPWSRRCSAHQGRGCRWVAPARSTRQPYTQKHTTSPAAAALRRRGQQQVHDSDTPLLHALL